MNNYCMLLVLKAPWYLNKKKYPLEIGYLFNEQVEQVDESPLNNNNFIEKNRKKTNYSKLAINYKKLFKEMLLNKNKKIFRT